MARTFNCGIGMVADRRAGRCGRRVARRSSRRARPCSRSAAVEPGERGCTVAGAAGDLERARRLDARPIMADRVRVAVLISGRGSNMLALSEHKRRDPEPHLRDRARRLERARGARAGAGQAARHHDLGAEPQGHGARASSTRCSTRRCASTTSSWSRWPAICGCSRPTSSTQWEGRILNIHPSLLPLHKGLDTHRRALLAGDEYAGCSVHLVTAELDSGPVIAQAKVRILPRDDAESLAARVLEEEHTLYPLALEEYCARKR